MNCIGKWPKIFNGNTTIVSKDSNDSTISTLECVHLLLSSEAGSLLGDPDFGIRLHRYVYNQNNTVLKDILIDEIYTALTTFCPQIYVERNNISITQEGTKVGVVIRCKDQKNFTNNTLNLVLFEEGEDE